MTKSKPIYHVWNKLLQGLSVTLPFHLFTYPQYYNRQAKLLSYFTIRGSMLKRYCCIIGIAYIQIHLTISGLSLPLPDLPVLGLTPETPNPSSLPKEQHLSNTVPVATETRNQWFIQPSLVPEYNNTNSESDGNQQVEKPRLDTSSYMIFFILMICVDVLMLLHRMIKAIGTGKLLLYGYPIYMDARDHRRKMHFSFMCSKISKNF